MNPYPLDAELNDKQLSFQSLCKTLKYHEFDDGWLPMLESLHAKLQELDPDYQILQIKEKFGGLRYYAECTKPEKSEQFFNLIHTVEAASYSICEVCGDSAAAIAKNENGWIKTVCDAHRIAQNRTWVD